MAKTVAQRRQADLNAAARETGPAKAASLEAARDLGAQERAAATRAPAPPPPPAPTASPGATPGLFPGDISSYQLDSPAAPSPQAPAASSPPPATPDPEAGVLKSASAQINAFLQSIPGLSALDPNNELGNWMNGQTSSLYGQGITDPTAILNTLQTTMNNPNNDPAAKAVFDQLFPGYNEKIASGTTNQNGSYTGIAGYLQYANQIQSFAQTAGLTNGVVTKQEIGNLWAGDVSAGEVSDRITSAYVAATNTPPAVKDYLTNTYGMNTGDIASYYLDPTKTLANLNAVNTGIAGVETGFGALSKAQADSLSAFLAPTSSNGLNAVSSQQAASALTSNLGGGVNGSAAQLAGLETAGPGQNAGGTVTQNELLSALGVPGEGTTQAQALVGVSQAQQTRTAGARGGGGAATTSSGASGLGFANQ